MTKDPINTIELREAQDWARKWRKEEGEYNAHHEVHAFLIPVEDINQLIEQGVDAVRAYLGVDKDDVEKLMIVGTRWNDQMKTYDDMLPGAPVEGLIYDFTMPCPPACGYNSPLNNLPPKAE